MDYGLWIMDYGLWITHHERRASTHFKYLLEDHSFASWLAHVCLSIWSALFMPKSRFQSKVITNYGRSMFAGSTNRCITNQKSPKELPHPNLHQRTSKAETYVRVLGFQTFQAPAQR